MKKNRTFFLGSREQRLVQQHFEGAKKRNFSHFLIFNVFEVYHAKDVLKISFFTLQLQNKLPILVEIFFLDRAGIPCAT
jgi:hypothetical protein